MRRISVKAKTMAIIHIYPKYYERRNFISFTPHLMFSVWSHNEESVGQNSQYARGKREMFGQNVVKWRAFVHG
jgi:hypothetical protein